MWIRITVGMLACVCVVFVLRAAAPAAETGNSMGFRLALVPIERGNLGTSSGDDPEKLREKLVYKVAKDVGAEIESPTHPVVVHAFNDGVFYLFYTAIEQPRGGPPYVVQRIKRTIRNYSSPDDADPETTVTYKVEVWQTGEAVKTNADPHFGCFRLGDYSRREIIKEFEIGFGQVPGIAEGPEWPFESTSPCVVIQNWKTSQSVYDRVKHTYAKTWTLSLSFDREGHYSMKVPEFGIDAPNTLPQHEAEQQDVGSSSSDVALTAGHGVGPLVVGKSRAEDVAYVFGAPVQVYGVGEGAHNYVHEKGLTFTIGGDGTIDRIITHSTFGGATAKGIRHGDTRERVTDVYGDPAALVGGSLFYPGIVFYFDSKDRVIHIVVCETSVGAHTEK